MSKKTKVITSNIQPNPKEGEIWAKVNEDGSREIKQYNDSTGKFECCGGSGSGSSDGIEYTYLDLRGQDISSNDDLRNILPYASFANYKGTYQGQYTHCILQLLFLDYGMEDMSGLLGLAIDENFMITNMGASGSIPRMSVEDDSEQQISIKEAIEMTPAKDLYNSIPRITKEEFYNLEPYDE